MPVTPLLGRVFGTLEGSLRTGQAKIAFPYGTTAQQISANFRALTAQRASPPTVPPIDFGIPEVPVDLPEPGIFYETNGEIRPVFTGPMGGWRTPVPRETVRVEEVSTEVERHPDGDYPAGSIFAPGRTWGGDVGHGDFDEGTPDEEPQVGIISDLIGGAVDAYAISEGYSPAGYAPTGMYAGPAVATTRPAGRAATPAAAAPVLTQNGVAECGNRRYVTLDRQTGKISCKRRRRRRLLTNRDLADLASLKTITGGGAALNAAVIRAVR